MIDRVSTNNQAQYLLSQIMQANVALNKSQEQVASGKVSSDYAGIGSKTAMLEAARSASTIGGNQSAMALPIASGWSSCR